MKFILFLVFCTYFFFPQANCLAQSIHGKVTDSLGKGVSYVSVNLTGRSGIIISYTITSENGEYQITVPLSAKNENLRLEVNCIGFKKENRDLSNLNIPYNFSLRSDSFLLKAVTIKTNRPVININGDTITYRASDFSNAQDRVIGDVIKKIPGIHVDPDGKISYNGKPISNFYIDGDNLLDDKYNIATTSIPNKAVAKIQVLQNNQPIKMLQGKEPSDDVALNITMAPDARVQLLGQAELGAGLPGKFDDDVTALMFKDRYKAINYIKANDVGTDLANDILSHNSTDDKRIDYAQPTPQLSLGTVGNPDLPPNRYLFNQAVLASINNLVKLKNNVQLKLNISYLHDTQRQQYQSLTKTFLAGDTVNYSEIQNNKVEVDLLHLQFNINTNTEKHYLNDAFSSDIDNKNANSDLLANGENVNQGLKSNINSFYNDLNYIVTTRGGLVLNFYSYINYFAQPETLNIGPNLDPVIFNNGLPYNQLIQQTSTPTWMTNNYLLIKKPFKNIFINYKIGLNIQRQNLKSNLTTIDYTNTTHAGVDSSANNLNWLRKRLYTDIGINMPGKRLMFDIDFPIVYQQTSYNENSYNLNNAVSQLFFNPNLKAKLKTSVNDFLSLNYKFVNDVGNIYDVYRGYILKNYRSLEANNAGLSGEATQSTTLGYNYLNPIKIFFFNIDLTYSHINANNISSSVVSTYFLRRETLPLQNATDSWMIHGFVSKYVFALHATISGGPYWQVSTSNQIQNGVLLPFKTISSGLNTNMNVKLSKQVNLSYVDNFIDINSSSALSPGYSFTQLQQKASFNYVPLDNLFFNMSFDIYDSYQSTIKNSSYSFGDCSARYTIKKQKIDLEIKALNVFNTTTYTTPYIAANVFALSEYQIPGRTILLKVRFNY